MTTSDRHDPLEGLQIPPMLEDIARTLLAQGNEQDIVMLSALIARMSALSTKFDRRNPQDIPVDNPVEPEKWKRVRGLESLSGSEIKLVGSLAFSIDGAMLLIIAEASAMLLSQFRQTILEGNATNIEQLEFYNRLLHALNTVGAKIRTDLDDLRKHDAKPDADPDPYRNRRQVEVV